MVLPGHAALVTGGRYLTLQMLYGLRVYWVCGAVLCVLGLGLALARAPVVTGAFAGACIELGSPLPSSLQAKRSAAA